MTSANLAFNGFDLSKLPPAGLAFVPSEYAPASDAAIKAAIDTAIGMSIKGSDLFRLADINSGGGLQKTRRWVCVAGNAPREYALDGGCIAFVYPGRCASYKHGKLSTHPSGVYSYPDPKDDPVPLEWMKFILDPELSPWRRALPFVYSLDPEWNYNNRVILFHQTDALPYTLWQSMLIAARFPFEKPSKADAWWEFVKAGIPKNYAFLLATHAYFARESKKYEYGEVQSMEENPGLYSTGPGGHEAFDEPVNTAAGFMSGVYTKTTRGVTFLTSKKINVLIKGNQVHYDDYGYSPGFRMKSEINERWKANLTSVDGRGKQVPIEKFIDFYHKIIGQEVKAIDVGGSPNTVDIPKVEIKKARRIIKVKKLDLDL